MLVHSFAEIVLIIKQIFLHAQDHSQTFYMKFEINGAQNDYFSLIIFLTTILA